MRMERHVFLWNAVSVNNVHKFVRACSFSTTEGPGGSMS